MPITQQMNSSPPSVWGDYDGIKKGDSLWVANFRADRIREILQSLIDDSFDAFPRKTIPSFTEKLGLVPYSQELSPLLETLFPKEEIKNVLAQWLTKQQKTQLHIAETEKYAHVTFFFNGGKEDPFEGEDRILIPSPKVSTYDLQPEMSAESVTQELEKAIRSQKYDFIVVNYANGDMVGHTGLLEAAQKAAAKVDECLGRLETALKEVNGTMIVTADHGNLEQMYDASTQQPNTAHTTNPVPFILVNGPAVTSLKDGKLCNLAPSVLDLMELPKPQEMTGNSLLVR